MLDDRDDGAGEAPPPDEEREAIAGEAAIGPIERASAALESRDLATLDAAIDAMRGDAREQMERRLRTTRDAVSDAAARGDRAAALAAAVEGRVLVGAIAALDPDLVLGARPLNAADLAAPLPPIDWVSRDLQWAPGRPNMITGYAGSAKSLATLAAAVALAAGRPIWGVLRASRRRVVVLVQDSGKRAVMGRLQRLGRGMDIDVAELIRAGFLCIVPHPRAPLTDPRAPELYRVALAGFDLCIMDALRGFVPDVDESDSRIRAYLDPLTEVSDATGCAIVVLAHEAKGGPPGGKGGRGARPDDEAARGSAGIMDAAGAAWRLVREERDGGHVYALRLAKAAEEPPGPWPEPAYLVVEDVTDAHGNDPRWGLRVEHRTREQAEGSTTPDAGNPTTEASAGENAGGSASRVVRELVPRVVRELAAAGAKGCSLTELRGRIRGVRGVDVDAAARRAVADGHACTAPYRGHDRYYVPSAAPSPATAEASLRTRPDPSGQVRDSAPEPLSALSPPVRAGHGDGTGLDVSNDARTAIVDAIALEGPARSLDVIRSRLARLGRPMPLHLRGAWQDMCDSGKLVRQGEGRSAPWGLAPSPSPEEPPPSPEAAP